MAQRPSRDPSHAHHSPIQTRHIHFPDDLRHLRLVVNHAQPPQQLLIRDPLLRHRRHLQQNVLLNARLLKTMHARPDANP
jgi:hypothetical protein